MIRRFCYAVMLLGAAVLPASVHAEETLSERLGGILQERADSHFNADFEYQQFELVTLLGELRTKDIRLSTRLEQLDNGLNQVLRAEQIIVKGQWLTPQQSSLVVDSVVAENAQLTVAYYGKGQSNLHALYAAAKQHNALQRTSNPLVWQVKQARLNNVVLNLFDKGLPILSVRLDTLELPAADANDTADSYIAKVLWPVLEQVLEQALAGDSDAVVDMGRLTQFIWREIR